MIRAKRTETRRHCKMRDASQMQHQERDAAGEFVIQNIWTKIMPCWKLRARHPLLDLRPWLQWASGKAE